MRQNLLFCRLEIKKLSLYCVGKRFLLRNSEEKIWSLEKTIGSPRHPHSAKNVYILQGADSELKFELFKIRKKTRAVLAIERRWRERKFRKAGS